MSDSDQSFTLQSDADSMSDSDDCHIESDSDSDCIVVGDAPAQGFHTNFRHPTSFSTTRGSPASSTSSLVVEAPSSPVLSFPSSSSSSSSSSSGSDSDSDSHSTPVLRRNSHTRQPQQLKTPSPQRIQQRRPRSRRAEILRQKREEREAEEQRREQERLEVLEEERKRQEADRLFINDSGSSDCEMMGNETTAPKIDGDSRGERKGRRRRLKSRLRHKKRRSERVKKLWGVNADESDAFEENDVQMLRLDNDLDDSDLHPTRRALGNDSDESMKDDCFIVEDAERDQATFDLDSDEADMDAAEDFLVDDDSSNERAARFFGDEDEGEDDDYVPHGVVAAPVVKRTSPRDHQKTRRRRGRKVPTDRDVKEMLDKLNFSGLREGLSITEVRNELFRFISVKCRRVGRKEAPMNKFVTLRGVYQEVVRPLLFSRRSFTVCKSQDFDPEDVVRVIPPSASRRQVSLELARAYAFEGNSTTFEFLVQRRCAEVVRLCGEEGASPTDSCMVLERQLVKMKNELKLANFRCEFRVPAKRVSGPKRGRRSVSLPSELVAEIISYVGWRSFLNLPYRGSLDASPSFRMAWSVYFNGGGELGLNLRREQLYFCPIILLAFANSIRCYGGTFRNVEWHYLFRWIGRGRELVRLDLDLKLDPSGISPWPRVLKALSSRVHQPDESFLFPELRVLDFYHTAPVAAKRHPKGSEKRMSQRELRLRRQCRDGRNAVRRILSRNRRTCVFQKLPVCLYCRTKLQEQFGSRVSFRLH